MRIFVDGLDVRRRKVLDMLGIETTKTATRKAFESGDLWRANTETIYRNTPVYGVGTRTLRELAEWSGYTGEITKTPIRYSAHG